MCEWIKFCENFKYQSKISLKRARAFKTARACEKMPHIFTNFFFFFFFFFCIRRHTPSVYSAATGFRSPYPSSIPINTSLSRYVEHHEHNTTPNRALPPYSIPILNNFFPRFFFFVCFCFSDFSFRFSPSLLPSVHSPSHHVINSHPAIVTPGPKQDVGQDSAHRYGR